MLGFLEDIWDVVGHLPEYLLLGLEEAFNLLMRGLEAVVEGVLALLPALPEPVAPPTIVAWLNWFYPVGAIAATLTTLVSLYVTFLAVRWILKKAGVV